EAAVEEHLSKMQALFFKKWKGRNPWKEFEEEPWKKHAKVWTKLQNDAKKTFISRGVKEKNVEKYMITEKKMRVWSWDGMVDTTMSPIDSIMYYRMFLQTGFMAVDQHTGTIKAWVGGINYSHFQYDHVNINTKRQVGSTFKPFIYTLAIKEKGYSPCFKIPNEQVTFEKDDPIWPIPEAWTAKNAGGEYGSKHSLADENGMMTIKNGLKGSVNVIAAYLMHELNPTLVLDFVKKLGVTSNIPPVPSIALGTPDISLTELVGAYTTFSNNGYQSKPFFITRIEDNHGNLITSFEPEQTEALDKHTAYIMTQLLRNVVDKPGGTARRIRFKYDLPMSLEIAGKTGTTQNNSDGWFMGYTPDLLAGTWVGCEDRYVHFRRTANGQGASTALPIWAKFMKKVYSDTTLNYNIKSGFPKPPGEIAVTFDCSDANIIGDAHDDASDDSYSDWE
ncbi:MAG: penicillin-binding protein 1A, partial [Planctomycetota bacterium]